MIKKAIYQSVLVLYYTNCHDFFIRSHQEYKKSLLRKYLLKIDFISFSCELNLLIILLCSYKNAKKILELENFQTFSFKCVLVRCRIIQKN
ncbi:hypothetical protein BpHYR1_000220 [Brachionus plicatilis]|uniref:Uncharacterized protein n=1 Tax=Brachionus plicatilis TaxID=10195 RepID=A0A3M7R523_BRAPC|nr:hypothetical protein BpHYR1_000220 [Brachionus plicatilis]